MSQPTTYSWIIEQPSTGGTGTGGGGPPVNHNSPPPVIITELTTGGCIDVQQSAISEMRDQLFLDSADNLRLNIVTSNLGMDRPVFGFDDDKWRFAGKQLLLQSKNVKNSIQRCLEVCLGPQKTRIGDLSNTASAGDKSVFITDPVNFLQVGTLIFDPGLPTEEFVGYCFIDFPNREVLLSTKLQFSHAVRAHVASYLTTATTVGATTLILSDTSDFPVIYPYSIICDKGLITEELLVVTTNNIGTNTLTLLAATKKPHSAAVSKLLRKTISSAQPAKVSYIKVSNSKNFPASGFVRINKSGGTQETVEYTENDATNNALNTKTLLKFTHVATESVELIDPGAIVETCSVVEQGIYWDIFETAARRVSVFVPQGILALRSIDASWLHKAVPGAFSTTLAVASLTTSTTLALTSASGLPDEAGLLLINGTQTVFYTFRDETASPHPVVTLDVPIGTAYGIGTTVALIRLPYGGTDLEDGNPRDSTGAVQFNRFPGPYIYDVNQFAPSSVSSSLSTLLPASINIAVTQSSGFTNIEVFDASSWPAPPTGFPFPCILSYLTGNQETLNCTDRTLKRDCAATVGTSTIVGVNTMLYTSTGVSEFPESDGVHPAGYRVIINKGGAHEEIAVVSVNNTGTHQFTFLNSLTKIHSSGETITLINDVVTFDVLQLAHFGPSVSPSSFGQFIYPFITQIPVVSSTGFTSSGTVYVNFGYEIPNARSKILSKTSNTVWILNSTLAFPTVNYPYTVTFGEGTAIEEVVNVTNNNTGTNTLTLSSPGAVNAHAVKSSYVAFTAGVPETINYTSKNGNNLVINPPILINSRHLIGERVMLSTGASVPNRNGFDYALKMPPRFDNCLTLLFNLVRAAGVKLTIIRDK